MHPSRATTFTAPFLLCTTSVTAESVTGITIDPASCSIHRLGSGEAATWRIHATDSHDRMKQYVIDLGAGKAVQHYTVIERNDANRPIRMVQHAPSGAILAQTILVYEVDGTIHQQLRCDAEQVLLAQTDDTGAQVDGF